MDLIIRLFVSVLINVVLCILAYLIEKRNSRIFIGNIESEYVVVQLPRYYFCISCVSIIISVILFFLVPHRSEPEFILKCVVSTIFFILGYLIYVGTLIWRIYIFLSKDYFIYRTTFGKKYKIFYRDCSSYNCDNNVLKLRTKGKRFFIDIKSENFQYFYEMLEENNVCTGEKYNSDKIIVKMSKGNFVAACICLLSSILFLAYMAMFPNETANLITYSFAMIFILLSFLLLLYTLVWKIEMPNDENYFLYRTMFGKTYVINYEDCNFPDKIGALLKITTQKRSFYIDTKAKNFETFLMTLKISKAIGKMKG